MKRFSYTRNTPNHLVGIGLAVLTLLLGGALFSFILVTRSAPKTDGTEQVRGIAGEVALHRNEYGIVHVIATNDTDAYFGIGYAHAQDRLWQMDFLRRVGQGRLAAVFGSSALEQDIFLRAMRFDSLADRLYRYTAPESRAALDAYARGVNAYLDAHKGRLAFEFDALDYEPEAWKPQHCLLLQRLWAWEMSSAFSLDLVLSAIADSLGNERARALLPPSPDNDPNSDPFYAPSVMDSLLAQKPKQGFVIPAAPLPVLDSLLQTTSATTSKITSTATRVIKSSSNLLAIAQSIHNVRTMTQMRGSSIGSNVWATRPSSFFHQETDTLRDSVSGQSLITPHVLPERYQHGALLANDLHTPFSTPTRFYEAHLTSPTLNVVGLMLPGLPFVLSGRNDNCAWGMANMMLDDSDFFAETLDSTDFKQIITARGAPEKFFFIADTIYVKDSSVAVVDTRYTQRSCVISDLPMVQTGVLRGVAMRNSSIVNTLADSVQNVSQKPLQTLLNRQKMQNRCITFSWTGQYMSDDALAWLRLNKAQSLEDARAAVQTLGAPALNLAFADRDGTISMIPCGAVPERLERFPFAGKAHPNFLRRGADTLEAWQRLVSASTLAELTNPPSGRVIAANNRVSENGQGANGQGANALHLSLLWDSPARAARIGEYLQDFEHLSARNMTMMQTDVVSHYAQMLVPPLLEALSASEATVRMRPSERQALKFLATWNGEMNVTSVAASIYAVFLERYTYNTLADELGEALYRNYVATTRLALRTMLHLTQQYNASDSSSAWWFDNKATPRIESRTEVIRQSFSETIDILLKRMNTDSVGAWQYGRIHALTLRHAFSEQISSAIPPSLRHSVESAMYPISGDATTLYGSEWSFNGVGTRQFAPTLGSTARFVCDMQDTLVYVSLTGGNSGEVFTKAASNQLPLWLNNVMIPLSVQREAHTSFTQRLLLVPASF
jgi:penicillin G amidase